MATQIWNSPFDPREYLTWQQLFEMVYPNANFSEILANPFDPRGYETYENLYSRAFPGSPVPKPPAAPEYGPPAPAGNPAQQAASSNSWADMLNPANWFGGGASVSAAGNTDPRAADQPLSPEQVAANTSSFWSVLNPANWFGSSAGVSGGGSANPNLVGPPAPEQVAASTSQFSWFDPRTWLGGGNAEPVSNNTLAYTRGLGEAAGQAAAQQQLAQAGLRVQEIGSGIWDKFTSFFTPKTQSEQLAEQVTDTVTRAIAAGTDAREAVSNALNNMFKNINANGQATNESDKQAVLTDLWNSMVRMAKSGGAQAAAAGQALNSFVGLQPQDVTTEAKTAVSSFVDKLPSLGGIVSFDGGDAPATGGIVRTSNGGGGGGSANVPAVNQSGAGAGSGSTPPVAVAAPSQFAMLFGNPPEVQMRTRWGIPKVLELETSGDVGTRAIVLFNTVRLPWWLVVIVGGFFIYKYRAKIAKLIKRVTKK